MLTESLVAGTYQQYKHDTNHLTNWLSLTAIKCGYDIERLGRNGSKKHASQKYTVSAQELKKQAQLIADCIKPRITLPCSIIKATKDAIEARKLCYAFYNHSHSAGSVSDRGHQLFIATLEKILDIIKRMPIETTSKIRDNQRSLSLSEKEGVVFPQSNGSTYNRKKKHHRSVSTIVKNKFSSLQIEDTPVETNEWLSHLKSTPSKVILDLPTVAANVSFEAEVNAVEEKQFELLCFFKDLCEVRKYVRSLWSQYKQEDISLVVACILTNAAVSSIKVTEELLADEHDISDLECHIDVFNKFFTHDEKGDLIKPHNHHHSISVDDFQDFKDVANSIDNFVRQHEEAILCTQLEFVKIGGKIEEFGHTVVPVCQVNPSKLLMSRGDKVAKEHKKLSQLMMDHTGLLMFHQDKRGGDTKRGRKQKILIEDMVGRGIRFVLEEDHIPIWAVLACRILLDAHEELGACSNRPLEEVLTQAEAMKEELEIKFPGDDVKAWMGCPDCVNCGTPELRRSGNHLDILCGGQTYAMFKSCMTWGYHFRDSSKFHVEVSSTSLFELNMIYCGTLSLSLLLDLEMIGIDFERRYAAIQITTHLYNASRYLEHVEVQSIPELDRFIQKQSYLIFGTAIPKTFKGAYDCLLRSIGLSPTAKLRDKHTGKKKFSALPLRSIRRNRTFDFLRQHFHGDVPIRTTLCFLMAQNGQESGSFNDLSGKYNLISILQTISTQLTTQLPEVNKMNYWSLANKCIWALSLIRTKLNHEFGNLYASSLMYSEQGQAIVRWFPMVANILQGAGEPVTGDCLTLVAAGDAADEDVHVCYCCGTSQLKMALEVLPKVWAFKQKKDA